MNSTFLRRFSTPAAAALVLAACVQPIRLTEPLRLAPDDSHRVLAEQRIAGPSPAEPGPFAVRHLYYGSGTDRRRAEYRDSVALRTPPVDGTGLLAASPAVRASRRAYWGFGLDSLPLNARVWYPDGPGPFPLVLVAHGHHLMETPSESGYAYLGELLASRGFITASVDQNFLNEGIGNETDARAWLLLKHLEVWKAWNDSAGSPFRGKVDMERIALVGHSRGGEAVAVAALFNRLGHHPDDATVRFDFGFGIRSLVAIAPTDGGYTPAGRPTPVENVNYLVFHGSHDADMVTFAGLRQYQRVRFTDGEPRLKAAFWMYRANHGQWNTEWGRNDNGWYNARWNDLRALLPMEEQMAFAKVAVSAFLEATLHGRTEYLPLFQDHRSAGDWLPKTLYVTRFQDAGFRPLADFTEDVDVATGTPPGVRITGEGLTRWGEGMVRLRVRGDSEMGHNAVFLGWDTRGADGTGPAADAPAWRISLPEPVRTELGVGDRTALQLSLLVTRVEAEASPGGGPPAVDLSVEFVDAAGVRVRLPLSRYGPIRQPPRMTVRRRAGRDQLRYATLYEQVLQTFTVPLADARAADRRFDPARLASAGLVFDRTPAARVMVSDVGLSNMDPAFFAPGTEDVR